MLTLRTSKNKNDVKNLPITISMILVNFHNFVLSHWPIGTESERVICWVMWIEASVGLGGECGASPAWANKELLAGQSTKRSHAVTIHFSALWPKGTNRPGSLSPLCVHTQERIPEEFSPRCQSARHTRTPGRKLYKKAESEEEREGEEKSQRRF